MNTATPQISESARQAKKNATELVIEGGVVAKLNEPESPVLPPKPEPAAPNGKPADNVPDAPMIPPPNPEKKISEPPVVFPPGSPKESAEPEEPKTIRVTADKGMVMVRLPVMGRGMLFTPDEAMQFGNQVCRTAEGIKAGTIQE